MNYRGPRETPVGTPFGPSCTCSRRAVRSRGRPRAGGGRAGAILTKSVSIALCSQASLSAVPYACGSGWLLLLLCGGWCGGSVRTPSDRGERQPGTPTVPREGERTGVQSAIIETPPAGAVDPGRPGGQNRGGAGRTACPNSGVNVRRCSPRPARSRP